MWDISFILSEWSVRCYWNSFDDARRDIISWVVKLFSKAVAVVWV